MTIAEGIYRFFNEGLVEKIVELRIVYHQCDAEHGLRNYLEEYNHDPLVQARIDETRAKTIEKFRKASLELTRSRVHESELIKKIDYATAAGIFAIGLPLAVSSTFAILGWIQ